MSKQGKKIEDIDQLLAMAGSNLSILEEEVDIKVQKEYFEMVNLLSKRTENYQKTSKQYLENINDLYDDTIDPEIKKKMLVVLATLDDVSVYRAIENFFETRHSLKKMGDYSAPTIQNVITIDSAGRSRCVYLYRAGRPRAIIAVFLCVFLPRSRRLTLFSAKYAEK